VTNSSQSVLCFLCHSMICFQKLALVKSQKRMKMWPGCQRFITQSKVILAHRSSKYYAASSFTSNQISSIRSKVTVAGVTAREIIDSRGNPTVETTVKTSEGKFFTASVPSGKSAGIHEVVELRDGDSPRFLGKGVKKAVHNVVHHLGPAVVASGLDVTNQKGMDDVMLQLDGSANLAHLGGNAILGISLALSRAGAYARKVPLYEHYAFLCGTRSREQLILPVPSLNVINGGRHSGNGLAIQEFMIQPVGASTFREALMMACETYQTLKTLIKRKYGADATNVGDEGGFAPTVHTMDEAMDLLTEAIQQAGYRDKIEIGIDYAASEFYDGNSNQYNLNFKGDKPEMMTSQQMINMSIELVDKYPMISFLEDPFHEEDFDSFAKLTERIGNKIEIVGDDLLCTNVSRVKTAIAKKSCNVMLCKPNQIGTVTKMIDAVTLCKSNGWGILMSHRSGETEDHYIADMAVGLQCERIKSGAPARSERLAKYNQLLRIEEELGSRALYAGQTRKSRHRARNNN